MGKIPSVEHQDTVLFVGLIPAAEGPTLSGKNPSSEVVSSGRNPISGTSSLEGLQCLGAKNIILFNIRMEYIELEYKK